MAYIKICSPPIKQQFESLPHVIDHWCTVVKSKTVQNKEVGDFWIFFKSKGPIHFVCLERRSMFLAFKTFFIMVIFYGSLEKR